MKGEGSKHHLKEKQEESAEQGEDAMNDKAKALVNLQNLEFSLEQGKQQPVSKQTAAIKRLRAHISSDLLSQYDTRKRRYGASSVVPVQGNLCSGCRISLSLGTRQRAYASVTECEHCARLVYNPARKRRLKIEIL